MLASNLTIFAPPTASEAPELRSTTALLLSYEGSIADARGELSAATRFSLVRLFRALGGAIAIFSERDAADLSRAMGLPDIPLVHTAAPAHSLTLQMDSLLQSPPFAGRRVVLCGAAVAAPALREHVLSHGGLFADAASVRSALGDWLESLAPMPVHMRAHA